MALFPPISLEGDNLGQRHQRLNSLVHQAKKHGVSLQEVEALPEQSPIDRFFKIDLAIELKYVDYIIRNLKDDDMLYVSRALKATWLIDNRDIINPKYLEDVLFPEMIKPAVTKMKHWLYINLRDPAMCEEFYQHYKEDTFEFAVKFLSRCSNELILEEAPKILTKLTTHSLKVLCEKCPGVAKIFFDSLAINEDLNTRYLERDQSYYNSVKFVLKSDADVFLYITEKYFNTNGFNRLSSVATDYILRYHKTRFTNKVELYVAYFLHIPTVAARLSVEECQEVVLKLARASYLKHWFEYKVVEPLIKRLSPDKRAAFKKRVFVDKDVGDCVDEWPYEIPVPPSQSDTGLHVFDDQNFSPVCGNDRYHMLRMPCMARCAMKCAYDDYQYEEDCEMIRMKTDLDRLFDEFRFIGFERALHELGQRLGATGSADRRRDIFLVLVSKSGGRTDAVSAVLNLAAKHSNEPPHTRASILRSLVKRANVWRLPADDWKNLLDFGHGLGLDGSPSEAACLEGLHCVVIRQLLTGECEKAVRDAFLKEFSTLSEYSLKGDERTHVANGLQNMLAAAAIDVEPAVAAERLSQLLDVLKLYRIRVEPTSPAVQAAVALALRDADIARPVLQKLYNARIARRELLRLNMEFRKDEAALVNALRHDLSVLERKQVVDILADRHTSFDSFTSKLVVYFQNHDFTVDLRTALKEKIPLQQNEKVKNVKLARPLASLVYQDFEKELRGFDAAGKDSAKFAAELRACAHRARPAVNLAEWGSRKAGVKAVATRAMRCREVERAALTRTLATERRTVRVALALSMRSTRPRELLLETFTTAAKLRPVVALHTALPYFRRLGANADTGVWDVVKPLFSSVDLVPRERLRRLLAKTDWIPSTIKPDYCATLYVAINKIARSNADDVLCDVSLLLPKIDEAVENILLLILQNTDKDAPAIPYPSIFVRYLLLSRNEEDVEKRFAKIGDQFLERLDQLQAEKESYFDDRLDQVLESLLYNSAFFDTKYSACLLVIERFLTWMQKFLSKEEHFKKYIKIHLTMLYFKAVRQSMKQMPEVFADPRKRKSEGVEAVGFVFGRYIAKEVAEFVSTYFDSIIELYDGALEDYLNDNFASYTKSKAKLIGSVIKGMLAEGLGVQRRLAVYVLSNVRYELEKETRKEIEEQMFDDKDIKIFAHAELFA
ncbi:hypothetical protein PYW07_010686 [Mythimna separata]|uniref:Uncharacterized protein n=1 Tax=Mythimna separata TaxID=271217 RepID=A0AAD7Y7J0_MYTSE|nr:hypothetical protein PYW07_010686 [Mythimna separata]